MEVVVTKFLNVRVGKPYLDAPCYQYLAPGSILTVEDKLYEGAYFEGSNKWLKDAGGNYYWAGGVEQRKLPIHEAVHLPLPFDEVLKQYPGNGQHVSIAFLDSGVNDQHVYLKNRIQYFESFLPGKSKANITSHGNRVAGILASDDPEANRNVSNLYCFRVSSPNEKKFERVDNSAVEQALKTILNSSLKEKINLINLSLDITRPYLSTIQELVNSLLQNGIICVVAAGENDIPNMTFNLQNVIKIVSFDHDRIDQYKEIGFPLTGSIYFLNHPIPSYSLQGNSLDEEISQDSGYCAFATALLAKKFEKGMSLAQANSYLQSISASVKDQKTITPFTPYI